MDTNKPFPIQGEFEWDEDDGMMYHKACSIPWWLALEAYDFYISEYGSTQSLERLAERGGFGRKELLMLLRKERI